MNPSTGNTSQEQTCKIHIAQQALKIQVRGCHVQNPEQYQVHGLPQIEIWRHQRNGWQRNVMMDSRNVAICNCSPFPGHHASVSLAFLICKRVMEQHGRVLGVAGTCCEHCHDQRCAQYNCAAGLQSMTLKVKPESLLTTGLQPCNALKCIIAPQGWMRNRNKQKRPRFISEGSSPCIKHSGSRCEVLLPAARTPTVAHSSHTM